MIDCPALHARHVDKGYPFGDRVPKTIRMTRPAATDFPFLLKQDPVLVATTGQRFPAWTNSYGAVAAVFPDGKKLGVKPDEFEVVEWHD